MMYLLRLGGKNTAFNYCLVSIQSPSIGVWHGQIQKDPWVISAGFLLSLR